MPPSSSTLSSPGKTNHHLSFLKMCSSETFKCSQTDDYIFMYTMEDELYFPIEVLQMAWQVLSPSKDIKTIEKVLMSLNEREGNR